MSFEAGEPPRAAFVRLFALVGFAVLAPLLELLRRHPQFLIAHGAGAAELAAIVASVGVVLPVALFVAERITARVGPRTASACRLAFVGVFAGMASLPPLVRALPGGESPEVGLVVAAVAGLAMFAFARSGAVRRFTLWLALGPPVFVALFWFDPSIAKVRSDERGTLASAAPIRARAPIVWIVFDEFPVASLMDAEGSMDPVRYPHFAALARGSTWFRDTASVADSTALAVPAILTARRPEAWRLPLASDHPTNLFSLLAPAYTLSVVETRTLLYDPEGVVGAAGPDSDWGELLSDLAILFAHLLAPADVVPRLPTIRDDWKDFASPGPSELARIHGQDYSARMRDWAAFVAGLEPCPERCLHFIHLALPHPPWHFTPEGRIYQPDDVFGIGGGRLGIWNGGPWWALQAEQRHLFQVAYADRLIGRVVEVLKRNGLYDRALLVVTADHGLSFRPGTSRRLLPGHPWPGDLLRVPFFLKAPGQATGSVSDAAIETVDILPTALGRIGIEIPWSIDGVDALAAGFSGRGTRMSVGREGQRFSFSTAELAITKELERRAAAFGTGATHDLYAFGRYGALVGRRVDELPRAHPARTAVDLAVEPFDAARDGNGNDTRASAARVTGRLRLPTDEIGSAQIAIAVRGRIVAVGPAVPASGRERWFSLFIPEPGDRAELAVFVVTGPPDTPALARARTGFAPILAKATAALRSETSADR